MPDPPDGQQRGSYRDDTDSYRDTENRRLAQRADRATIVRRPAPRKVRPRANSSSFGPWSGPRWGGLSPVRPAGGVNGVLTGGVCTGGVLTGGVLAGGVVARILTGGVFTGGVFTGGVFTGGVFTGGVFTGGVFTGWSPAAC